MEFFDVILFINYHTTYLFLPRKIFTDASFFMVYFAHSSFKALYCALVKAEITSHINLLQMEQMELTCVEHPILH